jgi:hypothetical protein
VIADLAIRIAQIEPRHAAIRVDFGFARVEFDGAVETGSILKYSISAYLGSGAEARCVADCSDEPDWARATAVETMNITANVMAKKILLVVISNLLDSADSYIPLTRASLPRPSIRHVRFAAESGNGQ